MDALTTQLHEEGAASSTRVRKLEREIANLPAELVRVQTRNDELEGDAKKGWDSEEERRETARRAKEERKEKLRVARRKRLTHGISLSSATWYGRLHDFAPPSGVPSTVPSTSKNAAAHSKPISPSTPAFHPFKVTNLPSGSPASRSVPSIGYYLPTPLSPSASGDATTLLDAIKISSPGSVHMFGGCSVATSNTLVESPVQEDPAPLLPPPNLDPSGILILEDVMASLKKRSRALLVQLPLQGGLWVTKR